MTTTKKAQRQANGTFAKGHAGGPGAGKNHQDSPKTMRTAQALLASPPAVTKSFKPSDDGELEAKELIKAALPTAATILLNLMRSTTTSNNQKIQIGDMFLKYGLGRANAPDPESQAASELVSFLAGAGTAVVAEGARLRAAQGVATIDVEATDAPAETAKPKQGG